MASLSQRLRRNGSLKVLSLFIALMLWLFVRAEEDAELVLRMPVRFVNVPEEMVIIGDTVPEIQIMVQGPRTLISQVERAVPPYSIDLGLAEVGAQQFRISPERVSLPRRVEVSRVIPSVIEVELRAVQAYRLPVQARLAGNLAPGHEISEVDIEPALIEIVTARGELDEAEAIRTDPIDVSGRRGDWSGLVPLDLGRLNLKSITTREVEVFLQIVPRMAERELGGVGVEVQGPGGPYRVVPATVGIRVMGPETLVRNLNADNLTAVIELDGATSTVQRRAPRVRLPEQVVLLEVRPAQVEIQPPR